MRPKLSFLIPIIMACAAPAFAQAPPTPATPPPRTAPPNPDHATQDRNCAPTQAVPSEGSIAPSDRTKGQSGEPLGDKLAKSDGVLCPPSGVDPEMHAPAPNTGTMPVIPPPGSPGGDPNVRPK